MKLGLKLCPAWLFCLLLGISSSASARAQLSFSTGLTGPEKSTESTGIVTGRVVYADTKAPARMAQVVLVKLATATSGPESKPAAQRRVAPLAFLGGCTLECMGSTGLDGRFEMKGIPAGRYVVLAQQQGAVNPLARIDLGRLNSASKGMLTEDLIKDIAGSLSIVTVAAGKTADVAVNLEHGATISGTITYDDGSPAVGVQVHLLTKTKDGAFEEPNTMDIGGLSSNASLLGYQTDESGRYHIAGILAGTYAIRADMRINQLKNLGKTMSNVMAISEASPNSLASALKMNDGLSVYSGGTFSQADIKPIEPAENAQAGGNDLVIPLDGLHSIEVHVEDMSTGQPLSVAKFRCTTPKARAFCARATWTTKAYVSSATFPTAPIRCA